VLDEQGGLLRTLEQLEMCRNLEKSPATEQLVVFTEALLALLIIRFVTAQPSMEKTLLNMPKDTCTNRIKFYELLVHIPPPVKEKPPAGRVYCNRCSLSFNNEDLLHAHRCMRKEPLRCSQCPRTFAYPCHLSAHLLNHASDATAQCPVCKRMFKSMKGVSTHQSQGTCGHPTTSL
jgi:hypothetical protein